MATGEKISFGGLGIPVIELRLASSGLSASTVIHLKAERDVFEPQSPKLSWPETELEEYDA